MSGHTIALSATYYFWTPLKLFDKFRQWTQPLS